MKTKPCTLGPRHKWSWIKNVSVGSLVHTSRGTHGQFTLRVLYQCQCGLKKHGQFNPNGDDLRSIGKRDNARSAIQRATSTPAADDEE